MVVKVAKITDYRLQLQVISDRFIALFAPVVIGWSNYYGVCFSTVI